MENEEVDILKARVAVLQRVLKYVIAAHELQEGLDQAVATAKAELLEMERKAKATA